MSKKIIVTIDGKTGLPKIEADGFNGQGCVAATAPLEALFTSSGEVEREYKEEWASTGGNSSRSVSTS